MMTILQEVGHKSRVFSSSETSRISLFIDKMPNYSDFFSELIESYPTLFSMEEFDKINSYVGKLRYAKTHLTKL